jgi:hypothetical protein
MEGAKTKFAISLDDITKEDREIHMINSYINTVHSDYNKPVCTENLIKNFQNQFFINNFTRYNKQLMIKVIRITKCKK